MNMNIGQVRVAAVTPKLKIANPEYNTDEIIRCVKEASQQGAGIIVFPELAVTGVTCGDLFLQDLLYQKNLEGLQRVAKDTKKYRVAVILGFYLKLENNYYNCAAFIQDGEIRGIVPKMFAAGGKEVGGARWFASGSDISGSVSSVTVLGEEVPFGYLIFADEKNDLKIGIEVSDDLFVPVSPGAHLCMNGAHIIFNPGANPEAVGKSAFHHAAIAQASAKNMCGYVHVSAGLMESTTDLVFGGDGLVAENGTLLARSSRFNLESAICLSEIDYDRIKYERAGAQHFNHCGNVYSDKELFTAVPLSPIEVLTDKETSLIRYYAKNPFVPRDRATFDNRCKEIFNIQASGLARRIAHTNSKRVVIGISGGLDSTLALLVCVQAFKKLGRNPADILAITMPGFGTTDKTYNNALSLMELLGVEIREISITEAVSLHFSDIGHSPEVHDVTYENAQARERTQILMDVANKEHGFVVGTCDLSETALGWSTFNGDQMSMYCVNAGVPKTLVQFVIKWVTDNTLTSGLDEDKTFSHDNTTLRSILADILATPISPELLPPDVNGQIAQKTEEKVGPYVLNDFFLFYTIRYGMTPKKLLFLAQYVYADEFSGTEIKKWLLEFYRRFFFGQFKRNCSPDGPKVGSVGLSPRGGWTMPSDIDPTIWLGL